MKKAYFIIFLLPISILTYGQDTSALSTIDTFAIVENVTIFKDPRLDILNTRPALILKEEKIKEKAAEIPLYNPIVTNNGHKVVTGSIVTKQGFRIIIYNGTDRVKATEAKNIFMRANPGVRAYMSYYVPSYKIKIGDFEDKKTAINFQKRIAPYFPSSFVVPDIVTIKNINVIQQ